MVSASRQIRRRFLPLVGAALVVGGAIWAVTHLRGVRHASIDSKRVSMNDEQRTLSDDVGELERRYTNRDSNADAAALLTLLETAEQKQRQLLALNPRVGIEQAVRLERLVRARDTVKAQLAAVRIDALERVAEAEQAAGHGEAAQAKWREALALQREIERSEAEDRFKNQARTSRLVQRLETAEAEPVFVELEQARNEAAAAAGQGRRVEAIAAYRRARELQTRLNREFARTRFSDRAAVDEFEAEIATLEAADGAARIDEAEQRGDRAAAIGRMQQAAAAYREAGDAQRELNERFARSRFVSRERIEALETKRDSALAAEMLTGAAGLGGDVDRALSKRQVRIAERKVGEAIALLDQVARDFPKARGGDKALRVKLDFLQARRSELRRLQDTFFDGLRPVPETEKVLMSTGEVSQELYQALMDENPSRSVEPTRPVESVSWHDAAEFCRRGTWLLGVAARLPAREEFRNADRDRAEGDGAGFKNLRTGLSEWLADESAPPDFAWVASIADSKGADSGVVFVPMAKSERARHVGFRVVVELASD